MKSRNFNENLANLKLQFFLGLMFWGRRCGSPAPKFWEGLPAPPKRPIRRPAGHYFEGVGGDALSALQIQSLKGILSWKGPRPGLTRASMTYRIIDMTK
jgi:hypothetical protein